LENVKCSKSNVYTGDGRILLVILSPAEQIEPALSLSKGRISEVGLRAGLQDNNEKEMALGTGCGARGLIGIFLKAREKSKAVILRSEATKNLRSQGCV
jgi:hypothetical protein